MLSLIIVLSLAACGQGGPQAASPPTIQSTTPSQASTNVAQETPQSIASPSPASTATVAIPTIAAATSATAVAPTASSTTSNQLNDALVQKTQHLLAAHLGVDPKTLTLKSVNVREWPDGSLGCPAPGMMYPQIVTPGFQITFSDGKRMYDIHTDQSEESIVLCDNKKPIDLSSDAGATSGTAEPQQDQSSAQPVPIPSAASTEGATAQLNSTNQPMVQRAQQALANDLGIGVDAIKVVKIEAVEWNDGSLGCAKPGVMYLQVITPGYRIVLNAQGKDYEYHTDTRNQVVSCNK